MSPEELAGRVARLEANVASIQTMVEKLAQQPVETARLSERVSSLDSAMGRIDSKFERRLNDLENAVDKRLAVSDARVDRHLNELEALIRAETAARIRIAEEERRESEALKERREAEKRKDFQWKVGLIVVIVLGAISSILGFVTVLTG